MCSEKEGREIESIERENNQTLTEKEKRESLGIEAIEAQGLLFFLFQHIFYLYMYIK